MIRNIDTYELPESTKDLAFSLYEVKGENITGHEYPHKTNRPHRHNYYEICIFINGVGRHEIDFRTHEIRSNSIHFLSPGQIHLISREKNYHGYLLVFSGDFYSLGTLDHELLSDFPFFNYTSDPVLNLDARRFSELLVLVDQIRGDSSSGGYFTADLLRSYLRSFLLKCKIFYYDYFSEEKKWFDPANKLVREFRVLVEKEFRMYHYVRDYASMIGTTPDMINRHVKRVTGMHAGEFIHHRILLEIKRLLIHTDLTNKEIAYRLNFQDPSYFSRFFRKRERLSPSGFRAAMRKKYQK